VSPYALLALGVTAVGAAAPLIRLTHAPPVSAAFLRTLIGGLALLAVVVAQRRTLPHGRERVRALACGAILGLHFALWFVSLTMTTVAASTVLVCIQPVFVAALAAVLLKEHTDARGLLGIAVAVGGAALIAADGDAGHAPAPAPLLGNLLALAGALVVAFYPIVARRQHKDTDTLAFSALVALAAAVTLGAVAIVIGQPLLPQEVAWPAVLLLALIPTVIGQTALNAAIKHLPAAFVAGSILGEPVIATAAAALLLDETPGILTAVGSLIVLTGLFLLIARRRRAAA
jgi:drug/metabolite transporter (DMT)-like permease